jgi:DNA-binding NarL/FixJ family response regulator
MAEPESVPGGEPPHIAVFADLLFGSRVRAAADAIGTATVLSTRPDRIVEAVAAGAGTVFIDLDTRAADPVALIGRLRDGADTRGARIVAFASHVRTDLIEAARNAGADRVLARGAFARSLPALVRDPLSGAG